MELKKQVCSLDLAKRLKELGVEPGSLFYWDSSGTWVNFRPSVGNGEYSAFTVAELGEMLPDHACSRRGPEGFYCSGGLPHDKINRAETEADARAKYLIYLLENKLVEI